MSSLTLRCLPWCWLIVPDCTGRVSSLTLRRLPWCMMHDLCSTWTWTLNLKLYSSNCEADFSWALINTNCTIIYQEKAPTRRPNSISYSISLCGVCGYHCVLCGEWYLNRKCNFIRNNVLFWCSLTCTQNIRVAWTFTMLIACGDFLPQPILVRIHQTLSFVLLIQIFIDLPLLDWACDFRHSIDLGIRILGSSIYLCSLSDLNSLPLGRGKPSIRLRIVTMCVSILFPN
jgi:hypothetical protein